MKKIPNLRIFLLCVSAILLALSMSACTQSAAQSEAPAKAAVAPPAPYGPTPTAAQVKHAERAFYAFCHFTVDTFTDREWGLGTESETTFNPTQFDADQIVGSVKAAGMKGLILTCKHHDGFCLWPTKTTEHNISNSPYKNGKGDIVREMSNACHKAGMEFGVYLSPWDRNNPNYGKPEYIAVYRGQMKELLTNYGPVFEVWMDGANGGTGYYRGQVGPTEFKGKLEGRGIDRTRYYDWPTTWALMRQYQPNAILFSDVGPDSRWCGNEEGYSPDPCWQTYTPHNRDRNSNLPAMPGFCIYQEGGHGQRDGKFWMPSEVDVSIRPGWFWHASQNGNVRNPQNLMNVYMQSIGRGTTFNLNCPPDSRGRLHENDVESLRQFGEHLRQTFAENLAQGAKLTASNTRGNDPYYGPEKLLDNDMWSAWITDDAVHTPDVVLELNGAKTFNLIRLREDIRLGQRVEGVAVDAMVAGQWKELASAQSIGSCRIWRVPSTTTTSVRIRVTQSPVCPALSDFGLYLEPDFKTWLPPIGTDPKVLSAAKAKEKWKIVSASFEAKGSEAKNAIDGNPATIWHTAGEKGDSGLPQNFVVDMGEEKTLKGFTYLPRQDHSLHGMVDQYTFLVSLDGKAWTTAAEGEFGNLRANPIEQTVSFAPVKARYFKFVARHAVEMNHAVVAEIGVVE